MVVAASIKGHSVNQNDAFYWVERFNNQKALAELGYTFDGEELGDYEVNVLTKISALYDKEFSKKIPTGKGRK